MFLFDDLYPLHYESIQPVVYSQSLCKNKIIKEINRTKFIIKLVHGLYLTKSLLHKKLVKKIW